MATRALFPTLIYEARLPLAKRRALEPRLLDEALHLQREDAAGRRWSRSNYPGGFTTYGSLSRLHTISPMFANLESLITPHVRRFARQLQFDLRGRKLTMTDCWVSLMPRAVAHGLHLHPLSTISGTYYLQTPPGCSAIKLEDPRLDRFMAAPPRRARAGSTQRGWVSIPAAAGKLVLFESWLRHEVPAQPVRGLRVSVSFNYGWF